MKSSNPNLRLHLWLAVFGAALLASVPAYAQLTTIKITTDIQETSTRVVLNHDRNISYSIRESAGRVEVVYGRKVVVESRQKRPDDSILTRYEVDDQRVLVFHVGPGYRSYAQFELRNPFRLVIDLQGVRPEGVTSRPRKRDESKRIVVIDPGHGGIESGAIGPTGLREKDVTLDLARRLRQLLQQDGSINVVLTRDEDRLIGLDERTAIANHNRADLFISVHLNASPRTDARGAETYFLSSEATDDQARTLAALENRAYGVAEKDIKTKKGDGDARGLELVLWDLAQNQYLAESSLLGERVQRNLDELSGVRNRGVRQAPFRVLMGATMPSVLVEVGFISNPAEEERLQNLGYRNQLVNALASSVREFFDDLDRLSRPENKVSGKVGGS